MPFPFLLTASCILSFRRLAQLADRLRHLLLSEHGRAGHEEAPWELFFNEAIERFFARTYAGDYENQLIAKFMTYLPQNPPWKK